MGAALPLSLQSEYPAMTETVALNHPPVAKPATVSALALVLHLDCSRTCVGKLEAEG